MIKTDLEINGVALSFENPKQLCQYMEKNNISNCKATSTIASVNIFSSAVTLEDVRKWVKLNESECDNLCI